MKDLKPKLPKFSLGAVCRGFHKISLISEFYNSPTIFSVTSTSPLWVSLSPSSCNLVSPFCVVLCCAPEEAWLRSSSSSSSCNLRLFCVVLCARGGVAACNFPVLVVCWDRGGCFHPKDRLERPTLVD